jgi:hypothetical protein
MGMAPLAIIKHFNVLEDTHRDRPVVEGLSHPGRGIAAVDPVAGSGLLVIRVLTGK